MVLQHPARDVHRVFCSVLVGAVVLPVAVVACVCGRARVAPNGAFVVSLAWWCV